MTSINDLLSKSPDVSLDDYCPFGVATCFVRDEGEVREVKIVEPVPSAALEAILQGVPTSYEVIYGKTLGNLFVGGLPTVTEDLPKEAALCDRFIERSISATRTFKSRPAAINLIPLGTEKQELNFDLSKKRILNESKVVKAGDNVKQHEHTHKTL